MSEDEIKKSIEDLVDKALKADAKASDNGEGEDLNKSGAASVSKDTDRPSNGGKDNFKSGSPETEYQTMYKDKKGNMYKSLDEAYNAGAEVTEKVEVDGDGNIVKSTEFQAKKENDEGDINKASDAPKGEAFGDLDEDEIELVKAWRAEKQAEDEQKPYQEIQKSMTSALSEVVEPLKKAIEDRDEVIKSLTDKVEKLSNQPAYDKRSVDTLEPLEKGGSQQAETISKSQVLDTMLELQLEGKGVNSQHVAEFEATKNISDPRIKQLVMNEAKKRVLGN